MDQNLVYSKTPAGEEAIRQRTRVVQRNLRMVLILVDGKAPVGELSAKVGNAQLVEQSLQELERDGFIAPASAGSSVWVQSTAAQHSVHAADPEGLGAGSMAPAEPLLELEKSFLQASLAGGGEEGVGDIRPEGPPVALSLPPVKKEKKAANLNVIDFSRWRNYLPRPGVIGLGALLLAIGAIWASFGVPEQRYRHLLAEAVGQVLGQAVEVGELHLGWAGQPALVAGSIKAGNAGMSLEEIALVPQWSSLLSRHPLCKRVEVRRANLPVVATAGLHALGDKLGGGGQGARIVLHEATLGLGSADLPGRWSVDSQGGPEGQTLITNADRSLRATIAASSAGVTVVWQGVNWQPDPALRWKLDQVDGQALISSAPSGATLVTLSKLDVLALDGRWRGEGRLQLNGGKLMLDGRLVLRHMAGVRFSELLGRSRIALQGSYSADLAVRAEGRDWAALWAGLSYEGSISAGKGEVASLDLLQAVRAGVGSFSRGGATTFDSLEGRIRRDPKNIQLSGLALQSGLASATGRLSIEGESKLEGIFDVQLRGSANRLRAQVQLSGTVTDPQLRRLR